MALSQAVKESINAELRRQRVSMRELARRVGMGQQYLWKRVSTHKRADMELTPSELERVAAALGVPVSRLLRDLARVS
jgi:transcriptional regulator with XRE-family HTH domain